MSGSTAHSGAPSGRSQLPTSLLSPTPLHGHHGAGITNSSALMPTLTPATTTRQSVALGALTSLWGNYSSSTANGQPILPDGVVSTIIAHAHSTDAQELPSDLAASTGSVHSTTTTLTNTLPPTQSAAIRALNAPAFHSSTVGSKPAKSASSQTSITSQPVVVRTYSGPRHTSRPGSGFNTPRSFAMNGHRGASALSAGLAGRSGQLPAVEDFSFSAILRAVDPEIKDAIDAIAEICAKSRMSLADEYDAHLPPQGEITDAGPVWAANTGALAGRSRLSRLSQGWTATGNMLMSVPEASSSSEGLAQESTGRIEGSNKKRSRSAYGSLKSVISGGSGNRPAIDINTFQSPEADGSERKEDQQQQQLVPTWALQASTSSSTHPRITIVNSPAALNQLSFDTSLGLDEVFKEVRTQNVFSQRRSSQIHVDSRLNLSKAQSRTGTLSSIASWLPWARPSNLGSSNRQEFARTEARLRDMLLSSQNFGKGKAAVSAV